MRRNAAGEISEERSESITVPVIVLGTGGHARVVVDALLATSAVVLGATTMDPNPDRGALGVPVLGGDEVLARYSPDEIRLANGIGSTESMKARREIFERFKREGYSFARVIHPSAVIARNVTLGEGAQVLAGVVVQTGAVVGANAILNTRASVDHDCRIGDHVHIAPGVTLSGNVSVGDSTHIGCGATVIQGVQIGEAVVVGAGSVVIRNVLDAIMVAGVPARPLCRRA